MSSKPYEMKQKGGILTYPPPQSPSFSFPPPLYSKSYEEEPTPSSHFSRISPTLLWIIVTLAAIFFISGLIHLLIRYFIKKRPSFSMIYHSNRFPDTSRSHSLQRQLQQLFRLHDSGLDQASMDALPVFKYKDIMGLKEQFDCAVCLCEFSVEDKLRLLPICGHAFHIDCIGTWLLSNSTCPLCRSTLQGSGLQMENQNPMTVRQSSSSSSSDRFVPGEVERQESGLFSSQQQVIVEESEETSGKRVLAVRLGKWRSLSDVEEMEESSRSNVDARRCYSMGSFQYVVGESNLMVSLGGGGGDDGSKRIGGDSFSVSKVWLWSKRSRFSGSASAHLWVPSNLSSCSSLGTDNKS